MEQIVTHQKPVVLVIDDDELVRWNAVDILADHGFAIEEADCVEGAIRILESHPDIQLVFTDIQMPGAIDGLELAHRVHRRWPHIRVVVTSGRLRPASSEMPDGGSFIAKPYGSERLVTEINHMLEVA